MVKFRLKKFTAGTSLAIAWVLLITSTALAYSYSAVITVLETADVAHDDAFIAVDMSNQWMANYGFTLATALDTRVKTPSGTALKHMIADDRTVFIGDISADATSNFIYYAGESALSSFPVVLGPEGYLRITDVAGMEIDDDFEIVLTDAYINTTAGADKYILYKEGSIAVYVDPSTTGTINAVLLGTPATEILRPNAAGYTTMLTPNPAVANYLNVDDTGSGDGDTTYNSHAGAVGDTSWDYDGYNLGSTSLSSTDVITSVQVTQRVRNVTIDAIQKSVTGLRLSSTNVLSSEHDPTGTAYNAFTDTISRPGGGDWAVSDLDSLQVIIGLQKSYDWTIIATQTYVTVNYYPTTTVSVTGISSGVHDITVSADGVNLTLDVDGTSDSEAIADGAADNANDWYIGGSTVITYFTSYEHTVSSSLITRYEPAAIIDNTGYDGTADSGSDTTLVDDALTQANDYWNDARLHITGTTDDGAPEGETAVITDFDAGTDTLSFAALTAAVGTGDNYTIDFAVIPDEEVAGNDARMSWGYMPADITISLGSLQSSYQPAGGSTGALEPVRDVIRPVRGFWVGEMDAAGLRETPAYPFVKAVSNTGGLSSFSEEQVWILLGTFVVMLSVLAAVAFFPGHLLVAGIACAGSMVTLILYYQIYPPWTMFIAAAVLVLSLILERKPVL